MNIKFNITKDISLSELILLRNYHYEKWRELSGSSEQTKQQKCKKIKIIYDKLEEILQFNIKSIIKIS